MEGLMTFTGIVIIAFGILQIILFFKVWGMTNDVKTMKDELVGSNSKDLRKIQLNKCIQQISFIFRRRNLFYNTNFNFKKRI